MRNSLTATVAALAVIALAGAATSGAAYAGGNCPAFKRQHQSAETAHSGEASTVVSDKADVASGGAWSVAATSGTSLGMAAAVTGNTAVTATTMSKATMTKKTMAESTN